MKRKYIIIICFFILSICILFIIKIFNKFDNKKNNIVNNKNIQEIEKYLLNINTYTANIDVIIRSNKNENKYKIKQEVKENFSRQIIIEPEEISNMEIIYNKDTLIIRNTKLNISKVYNTYPYMLNNILFLGDFIKEYQEADNKSISEEKEEIVMNIDNKSSRYNNKKELKVNKETLIPKTLEIKDINNETKVYILYNEIEINNI